METYQDKIEKVVNEGKIKKFAYDGCHKIYLIENEEQEKEAQNYKYVIMPIKLLLIAYERSCSLKFINFWDSKKPSLIPQC